MEVVLWEMICRSLAEVTAAGETVMIYEADDGVIVIEVLTDK